MLHVSDRVKRAVAFYFSVSLFLVLVPIVLSYSLGYYIDFRTFNIYKTGIIYLKSQPAGAYIYINDKVLATLTPTRIEELRPGAYKVDVKKDGYYPWQKEMVVRPNMVTKAEDIVLFPLTQEMKRITSYAVYDFAVSDNNYIYYMTDIGLIRSSIDGTSLKRLSAYSNWPRKIIGKKFSRDADKLLFFSENTIWVAYLSPEGVPAKGSEWAKIEEVLTTTSPIIDVYWYSESKHVVFVTEKDINVVELDGKGTKNAVILYKFDSRPQGLYYDKDNDSLYFTDFDILQAGEKKSHLYRLDLRQKFFSQLMERLKKEFDIGYEER